MQQKARSLLNYYQKLLKEDKTVLAATQGQIADAADRLGASQEQVAGAVVALATAQAPDQFPELDFDTDVAIVTSDDEVEDLTKTVLITQKADKIKRQAEKKRRQRQEFEAEQAAHQERLIRQQAALVEKLKKSVQSLSPKVDAARKEIMSKQQALNAIKAAEQDALENSATKSELARQALEQFETAKREFEAALDAKLTAERETSEKVKFTRERSDSLESRMQATRKLEDQKAALIEELQQNGVPQDEIDAICNATTVVVKQSDGAQTAATPSALAWLFGLMSTADSSGSSSK